jgi:SpoIIAA-like
MEIKNMLKIMNDLPDKVLGVSAEGKITGTDYETVLIPAVENKLKAFKKISMLYQLGDHFTGFDLNAMLDDARVGIKHFSAWEKIALVSDHELINTFAKFFGYMLSCELRIFRNSELDEAKKWIKEK